MHSADEKLHSYDTTYQSSTALSLTTKECTLTKRVLTHKSSFSDFYLLDKISSLQSTPKQQQQISDLVIQLNSKSQKKYCVQRCMTDMQKQKRSCSNDGVTRWIFLLYTKFVYKDFFTEILYRFSRNLQ